MNKVFSVSPAANRLVGGLAVVLALASLTACAHRQQPVYEEAPTYAGQHRPGAQFGVVRSIEQVSARESTSGGGALLGAVVGAVVGRQFGETGGGRAAGTALGAVGGALIGNEIEHQQGHGAARWRVQVQMDDGTQRSFNFAQLGDLRVGDRVRAEGANLQRY